MFSPQNHKKGPENHAVLYFGDINCWKFLKGNLVLFAKAGNVNILCLNNFTVLDSI